MSTEDSASTYLVRIRPSLPHAARHVYGMVIERVKGWYPVTREQSAYLGKQPANELDPLGPKLFDAKTLDEAKEIDRIERRPARLGGSASNPIGLGGFVPPELADSNTKDLQERLAASEAKNAETDAKLAAIMARLNIDPASLTVSSERIPKESGKPDEAIPAKPLRPGAVQRPKPGAPSSAHNATTDDKTTPESAASEG